MRRGVLLAAALAAAAWPAAGRAVSLDDCLQRAARNAPSLAVADAAESRAARAVDEARAALNPTMRLAASFTQNNEAPSTVFDLPGSSESIVFPLGKASSVMARAEAQYTLYSGGRTQALVKAAEASRASQAELRRQAGADLRLRVATAYYRELTAKRLQSAAEEAMANAREHDKLSRTRVDAGAAPKLDALRAQVDVLDRQTAVVRAVEARRLARVELEAAMGETLAPSDSLDEPRAADAIDPDSAQVLAQAEQHRAELASLDREIDAARERARAARAGRGPTVNLSGNAQYLAPNIHGEYFDFKNQGLHTYSMAATLGLSVPILDGGLSRSQEAGWDAQRVGLEARRRDALLSIRRELASALSSLRVAEAVWQASNQRVSAAREALRLATVGYREGAGTATDVRDAENSLSAAAAEEAQSLMDFWSAHAQIDHAAGLGLNEGVK